ncbi:putative ATP-dependent RNA helicase ddx49 [Mortierella sp. AD094]|nr:putative ATP-dependent RNA helicase ddx49 [Mortierella sp. AD094]
MRDKRPLLIPVLGAFLIWMLMQYHRINLQEIGDCQDPLNDYCIMERNIKNLAFITSYYQSRMNNTHEDALRQAELDVCLACAAGHPLIQTVHVLGAQEDLKFLPSFANAYSNFHSDPASGSPAKLVRSVIQGRPMMADFIQYACDHLRDHRVMFANADIYFDLSLEYFLRISDAAFDRHFYAISRWEMTAEYGASPNKYIGHGSYDTFLFRPRVLCGDREGKDSELIERFEELKENLDYPLGVIGAENRLLYEIHRLYPELWIQNPARTVRTLHMHNSAHRDYYDQANKDGKSFYVPDEDVF